MDGKVKIGVAAWGDLNDYYPRGMKPAERLTFYSAEFPLVEVDTSYYAIPAPRMPASWVSATPDGFTFNVKAFRLFTAHPTPPRFLPPDIRGDLAPELASKRNLYYGDVSDRHKDELWAMFHSVVDTIRDAGRLGVVLFQFPPWFMPRRSSYAHVDECRERMAGYPVAVELRNRFWLLDDGLEETLGYLRRAEISFVSVDEPQGFDSSVPPGGGRHRAVRDRPLPRAQSRYLGEEGPEEVGGAVRLLLHRGRDGGVGPEDRDDAVERRRGTRDHEHQQPGPGGRQRQARGEGLRREPRPESQVVVTGCAPTSSMGR